MNPMTIEQLIEKLSKNLEAKHFFNNGACAKLAEYLYNEFFSDQKNTFLLCRFFVKYQSEKQEQLEDLNMLDSYDFLSCYSQTEHVAIVHNNIVYDVNGVAKLTSIEKLNEKDPDHFYCLLPIENKLDFSQLLDLIFPHHKYGHVSKNDIKNKIQHYANNSISY